MNTTRIDHTGHNHPATTAGRTACRKLTAGVKVGDMVQAHITPDALAWGVVLSFTPAGELRTRFSDTITLYIPANTVAAVERRAS